jgi:hypothetical protein
MISISHRSTNFSHRNLVFYLFLVQLIDYKCISISHRNAKISHRKKKNRLKTALLEQLPHSNVDKNLDFSHIRRTFVH